MNQFEEVLEDPELMQQLQATLDEFGGLDLFRDIDEQNGGGLYPDGIEIRRSPIPGRYSITIVCTEVVTYSFGDVYGGPEADEFVERIKFKWEPETGSFFCVIPWHAILKPRDRAEAHIRQLVVEGRDSRGDLELNRLLLEEAEIQLAPLARRWSDWARDLSAELGLNFLARSG